MKKCGLLGFRPNPNMAGWSKETWVKRFGLDVLHRVALPFDQHNFIPILILIIIISIFVVRLFTSCYLSHYWSHLTLALDMWVIPRNNDLKSLLTAKCPNRSKLQTQRVRRTWRPLSSLISTPLWELTVLQL